MILMHIMAGQADKSAEDDASVGWFSQLDPRAKIVGVFVFVVAAALLVVPYLVIAALVITAALAAASGVPRLPLAKAYLAALPFILMASVSVFLFAGIDKGFMMWARSSACVTALLVLAAGTEPFDLFSGLRRLRVPAVITVLLMLTQRYLLVLNEELDRMRVARKARGFAGGKSLFDRYAFRVLSNTAGMLLVRATARADTIYEGLNMRGFSKDMSVWRTSRIAALDALLMVALFFASGAMLFLQVEAGW